MRWMRPNSKNRATWLWLLVALILTPAAARSGPSDLLILSSQDEGPYRQMIDALESHLLGPQGMDLKVQRDSLQGSPENGAAALDRIAVLDPAMVLVVGQLAAEAVVAETVDRPIVAAMVLKMEHLAATNVTGIELMYPPQDQLGLIRRLCPNCRTVGVLFGADESLAYVEAARAAARMHDLQLVTAAVAGPRSLPGALRLIERTTDVWWVLPDKVVASPQAAKAILLQAFRKRIPLVGPSAAWVKAGALFALDWDYAAIGRQMAELAVQILKGGSIRDLAPRGPDRVLYSVNLKTAAHLKLDLPVDLVDGAKQVFD